jgi:hypothetical protein
VKQIDLKCSCGASVRITDEAESYILPDTGKPDKQGRRYQIELLASDWLTRHQKCTDLKNQMMLKAMEKTSKTPTGNPHQTM